MIIAQGGEAGGYGGNVSTMTLVPQVVDAVSPIPVVAAGGIFDGRGIAAALMLGAVGVNLGTRFLASKEAPISEEWKQAIVRAQSEDTMKVEVLNDISPAAGHGRLPHRAALAAHAVPGRVERQARGGAPASAIVCGSDIVSTHQAGRQHDTLLTAGQTAGGIKEILPVAEIMRQLIAEAEAALGAGLQGAGRDRKGLRARRRL